MQTVFRLCEVFLFFCVLLVIECDELCSCPDGEEVSQDERGDQEVAQS